MSNDVSPATRDSTAPPTLSPRRILVVDDAPEVARTIQAMLSRFGHKVETSGDGEDALARFAAGKYDLIITDYSMPKMNGVQLARAIKRRSAGQLILLITAFTFSIAAHHPSPLPVDLVLAKPFSAREFQEALDTLFSTNTGGE